ncbi:REP-associated tyrosine transposase [Thiocapsa bogorovii]|uniref:REP-associated tyrosine transposase n=1 Tax=Thiocapsa bogorovii TaxID=521689 RepID=UPI001E50261C|nr:transposase [Thiocapsa bogorovii]UHD15426.1 transposase [Thiocapsa bogorovii]
MPYSDLRIGRYSEPGREYLVTTTVHRRIPVFETFSYARICIRELAGTERETDASWLAWVLMPDHFHGLVRLGSTSDLSDLMRRFKGASAYALNRVMGRTGTLWQPGYHDHALRREESRLAVARYIVANPLRAGLAERPGDYPHWDSVWL